MRDASLAPGATVWIRDRAWRVDRVRRARSVVTLDVSGGGERRTFLAPFDRAAASTPRRRPTHVRLQHAAARLASAAARLPSARAINSAVDAHAALLPYQLEPALAVVAGGSRRVLIADEVGLGKTIQAAYCIAEVARREPHARILVLAPSSLIDQWRAELSRRFGLDAASIDRAALDDAALRLSPGDSPWRAAGVRIASLDFLKQRHVFDALPAASWDLLVVDEAHTGCGDSDRHARLDLLAGRARRVVLLTATPHDGDAAKFRRLLSIGAIASVDTPLVVFRRTRADAGLAVTRRTRRHHVTLSPAEKLALDALDRFGRLAGGNAAGLDLLMTVLRKRAMSTMRALALSVERRRLWLDARGETDDGWRQHALPFEDDEGDESEWRALTADTGLDPAHEREWLARLRSLAAAGSRADSKIARVRQLLGRTGEPVIVFTEYRDSLEAVRSRLSREVALAVLHGSQNASGRRDELRRFLTGEARVLAATDVAGVGLNLHERARWVITLDLPWNPIRLEQRIGRVDRIGQTRGVHHTILVARHAHEAHLRSHLDRRAAAAERALAMQPGAPTSGERLPATSTRYTRAARWMARRLAHRRALALRWRGARSPRSICRARLRAGSRGSVLLIFAAPVLDATGAEVDAGMVACRAPAEPGDRAFERAIEDARGIAARRARARADRLTRWLATHEPGRLRDHAIAQALISHVDAPVDVGLFDLREWRAHVNVGGAARRDAHDERRRQRALRLGARYRAGVPELLCILDGAR